MWTKIYIFLIASTFFFSSCSDNAGYTSPIPDIFVSFSISILNTLELQTPLRPKYIEAATGKKVGYKGHGIYLIKMKMSDDEYRAFDATCTFPNDVNASEHLLPVKDNQMLVVCPLCKSQFNLLDGNVQTGVATQPLRQYIAKLSGNRLTVHN